MAQYNEHLNTDIAQVRTSAEYDGEKWINRVKSKEIEDALALLLTKAGFDTKIDITMSALRDALRGMSNKTISDLATLLTSIKDTSVATNAKQDTIIGHVDGVEGLLGDIKGKDFATQTTLAAILTQLGATGLKKIIDPLPSGTNKIGKVDVDSSALPTGAATKAMQDYLADVLDSILAKIIAAPATEAKQDTAKAVLDSIDGKDFATQTTLAAILAKIIAAPATSAKQDSMITALGTLLTKTGFDAKQDLKVSELRDALRGVSNKTLSDLATVLATLATSAKQDTLAGLIGEKQASPTANTLLARIKNLEDKLADILDGTTPANVQLTGNEMELYGAAIGERPNANTVSKGTTFTIVDNNLDQNWISDGTKWVEV